MSTQRILVHNFYGGLNSKTAPHLVNSNQATKLQDAALISGALVKQSYDIDSTLIPASTNIKYYNNGNIIDLGTDEIYKGVKVIHFQDYDYILHEGVPKQLRSSNLINTIVSKVGLEQCTLSAGSEDLSNIDDKYIHEYTYYVTYKNSAGFESPMHKLGEVNSSVTLTSDKSKLVQSTSKILFNHRAGHKITVYRLGGDITNISKVFVIDENNVVTDTEGIVTMNGNEATFGILDKHITTVNSVPAKDNPPATFEYLTASKYGMAASSGNILYLSQLRPDAWSTFSSLNLSSAITGLTYTERGILAFTAANYLYYITGTTLENLTVTIINEDIGCDSHKSLVKLRSGAIVWLHGGDIYAFNGSSATNITAGKYTIYNLKSSGEETNAIAINNKYIVGTQTGVVTVDFDIPGNPIVEHTLQDVDNPTYNLLGNIQKFTYENNTEFGFYKEDNSFNMITLVSPEYVFEGYDIGDYTTNSTTDTSDEFTFGEFGSNVVDTTTEFGDIGCYTVGLCTVVADAKKCIYKSPDFVGTTTDATIILHAIDFVHIRDVKVSIYVDDVLVKEETIYRGTKGVTRVNYPVGNNEGVYTSVQLEIGDTVFGYSIIYEATPIP